MWKWSLNLVGFQPTARKGAPEEVEAALETKHSCTNRCGNVRRSQEQGSEIVGGRWVHIGNPDWTHENFRAEVMRTFGRDPRILVSDHCVYNSKMYSVRVFV